MWKQILLVMLVGRSTFKKQLISVYCTFTFSCGCRLRRNNTHTKIDMDEKVKDMNDNISKLKTFKFTPHSFKKCSNMIS